MKFTHKGWFWFCPVYLNAGDGEPFVEPRHWSMQPAFWLALRLEIARIFLTTMIDPDYEASFMFLVTGEL